MSTHHLATIVSGSKAHLGRFDASIELICTAPKLIHLLTRTSEILEEHRFIQVARVQRLDREITEVLDSLAEVIGRAAE